MLRMPPLLIVVLLAVPPLSTTSEPAKITPPLSRP
jgi:hypothetical protein